MVRYEHPTADVVAVMAVVEDEYGGDMLMPTMIVPLTPRAVMLFHRWGMETEMTGIVPPHNAMDLLDSLPHNWEFATVDAQPGAYLVQEITLPQPKIVLH